MNDLTNYQFDEQPVRVIMIAGDPWFVATDVAKVLGYSHSPSMYRMLDEDQKGVHIVDTLGGNQEMNVISESGLYAAILKSRRAEANRFRRWVTGEVLPSIRRTGKYALAGHEPERALPPEDPASIDAARLHALLGVTREARRLFGVKSARSIWLQLGLPVAITDTVPSAEGDPLAEPLKEWLEDKSSVTLLECCKGLNLASYDMTTRRRVGALLKLFGWSNRVLSRNGQNARVWTRGEEA